MNIEWLKIKNSKEILTDAQLIEKLKEECRRVKIQRNEYEKALMLAHRRINNLNAEISEIKWKHKL